MRGLDHDGRALLADIGAGGIGLGKAGIGRRGGIAGGADCLGEGFRRLQRRGGPGRAEGQDPGLAQGAFDDGRAHHHVHAHLGQRIRRARFRTEVAVAMLGHRHACARHHEGGPRSLHKATMAKGRNLLLNCRLLLKINLHVKVNLNVQRLGNDYGKSSKNNKNN